MGVACLLVGTALLRERLAEIRLQSRQRVRLTLQDSGKGMFLTITLNLTALVFELRSTNIFAHTLIQ